ncbi:MAG: tyrosine-type recombinase/integrase [Mucilaginibacter sp.]|uniref:tyrosine-type recombinase/integrase n=1 Tax=Mucilaginibacter sp. TaxID=1882438 RepID=UPI003264FA8F
MSSAKTFNFTKPALLALQLPNTGKRVYYRDSREQGLILDVRPSGSKTFYLYKKIAGRPERLLIGSFPDTSIENARKAASVLKGQIASGKNPQEEKRGIRNEMTFQQLFDEYMTRYSKQHKETWQQDEQVIKNHFSHFLNKKISAISQNDVQRTHARIGVDSGHYAANNAVARLRAIFNRAIEWGWQGINPATKIKEFKEATRDRFMQPEELPRFVAALDQEDQTIKDYTWLLLLTGSRKSKVTAMRWADIRWHQQEWHIPNTKNGDPIIIPLTPQVLQILQQRWQIALAECSQSAKKPKWVFPSNKSKTGHIACPAHSWKKLLEKAEIENFRMHDLRRTLGSYQAITGASLQIIGKSLGHRSPEATLIYARLHLDPVRAAVEKATNAMFSLSQNNQSANTLLTIQHHNDGF